MSKTDAVAPGQELAIKDMASVPAEMMEMFAGDSNSGFQETNKDDYAIPFVKVLQSMSPQCKRSDGAYIAGAVEGMLFNTVTEELVEGDKGILLVPCYYRRNYLEFSGTQEEGGTFVAEHSVEEGEEILKNCEVDGDGDNRIKDTDGHILVEVRNHYCLQVNEEGTRFMPILLSLSSTQIKHSKKWMMQMQNIKLPNDAPAPMFSQIYRLTTKVETKDKFSWFGIKLDHIGAITNAKMYRAAKEFMELVRSDVAQAEFDKF